MFANGNDNIDNAKKKRDKMCVGAGETRKAGMCECLCLRVRERGRERRREIVDAQSLYQQKSIFMQNDFSEAAVKPTVGQTFYLQKWKKPFYP